MRAPVTMQEAHPASGARAWSESAQHAWLDTMQRVSGQWNVTTAERVALESIGLDDHRIVRLCLLDVPRR